MKKNNRKIILIDREYQLRMIRKFIMVNILVLAIFGFLIFFFINNELDANLRTAHVTYRNMKDMLLPIVATLSIINVIISSILIFIFVLFASHKLAGPLFRFLQVLKSMTERDYSSHTGLREGDQLQEISGELENCSEVLKEDIRTINEKMDQLENAGSDPEAVKKITGEVKILTGRYNFR